MDVVSLGGDPSIGAPPHHDTYTLQRHAPPALAIIHTLQRQARRQARTPGLGHRRHLEGARPDVARAGVDDERDGPQLVGEGGWG